MPRLIKKFFQAKNLRKKGYSFNEISQKLIIGKSTASIWLRNIKLSPVALKRLEKRKLLGTIKASETKRGKREKFNAKLREEALDLMNSTDVKKNHLKIFCALLFVCEGTKDTSGGIYFSNSDPVLVKTFLTLLRSSFDVQEKKFRILLHLHEYHSPKKQISFWSKITCISPSQFSKPYRKPHTGKRVRENYQGCVNIKYYDSLLARKLFILGQQILNKYGDVG